MKLDLNLMFKFPSFLVVNLINWRIRTSPRWDNAASIFLKCWRRAKRREKD
jgi:hypothetical protein